MYNVSRSKNGKGLIGKIFETNLNGKCVLVDYVNATNVTVEFIQYPCKVNCTMGWLRQGKVSNPMYPSTYGVGCVGLGIRPSEHKVAHKAWGSMLMRGYCPIFKSKYPTYRDVTVCKEWLNFQNFAKWCENQVGFNTKDDKGSAYHLDKDILSKGNKIYSSETCCFVPQDINKLLHKSAKSREGHPIGVHYDIRQGSFKVSYRKYGISKHIGYFDDLEDAFQAYKKAKESYVKEVAVKWKDCISTEVFQALMNWEVV